MSGSVSEIATLILEFTDEVDATERGITQVSFSIESPPPGGLAPAMAAWSADNPLAYLFLDTPPITTTTQVTLPLSELEPAFDPSRMVALQFFLPAHVHVDYDFCVTNVKLLDAEGDEVLP